MIRTLTIGLNDGRKLEWDLDFSEHGTLRLQPLAGAEKLAWIRLEFNRCPACSLDAGRTLNCPVAEILARYATDLANRKSFELVTVQVTDDAGRRITLRDIALQKVVGELVRLAVFQAGCPLGRQLKPAMVELHPFPPNQEILQALARSFARGLCPDDAGRSETGNDCLQAVHEVLGCLCRRLEHAGSGDVYINAVVILHSLSVLFSLSAPQMVRDSIADL